jgi:hypothetical protein
MEDTGIFYGLLAIFRPFDIFYALWYILCSLVYFMLFGIFYALWYILCSLVYFMLFGIFYALYFLHFGIYFVVIWCIFCGQLAYILWSFGIFSPFWYIVRRKIWQPWSCAINNLLFVSS